MRDVDGATTIVEFCERTFVALLSVLLQRLQHLNSKTTGRLYGVMYDNALTVLTFAVNVSQHDDCAVESATLQLNMPVEIDLCGVLFIGECEEAIPDAFKVIIYFNSLTGSVLF